MRVSVVALGALGVLAVLLGVGGCNLAELLSRDKDEEAPDTTAAPEETTTAAPSATAESDAESGIPDCDQFLVKYRCTLRNTNQSQRSADEMATAWRAAADDATTRATTASVCRAKARAMQGDFVRAGCDNGTVPTAPTSTTTASCPSCEEDPLVKNCCGMPQGCSTDAACGSGVCCLDPGGQINYCFKRQASCPSGWKHFQSLGKEGNECLLGSVCNTGLTCNQQGRCVKETSTKTPPPATTTTRRPIFKPR